MEREYPKQPLVGVGAIIIQHGRIALIKRGKPPLMGEWSVPGGMLELGETVRHGVQREALEETGLVVQARELLGVFDRIVSDAKGQFSYHYVLVDFLCEVVSGELCAGHDACDANWFAPDQVVTLPLAADTAEVIRLGFSKAG